MISLTFDDNHSEDDCDKCLERVGKKNLTKVPFLFKDMNDTKHEDVSYLVGGSTDGYRQYWICKKCMYTGY